MKQIELGSTGNQVIVLQKLLSKAGHNLLITGTFDASTDNIIKNFQRNQGLGVDGVVGKNTWKAVLNRHYDLKLGAKNKFLEADEFRSSYFPKNTIYLHHTAGGHNPRSVIHWWETDRPDKTFWRVATAFVIGRESRAGDTTFDGVTYRAFREHLWAGHLGLKQRHTQKSSAHNQQLDKQSIGFEICSYGHLTEEGGKFFFIIKDRNGKITTKREIPPSQVCTLDRPWRGKLHFQKYTDKQIAETKRLTLLLSFIFDIPIPDRTYTQDWFEINQDAIDGKPGIWTHANVRPDKTDCFPQPELIDMLNGLHAESLTFIPTDASLESLGGGADIPDTPINDEDVQNYTRDLDASDI